MTHFLALAVIELDLGPGLLGGWGRDPGGVVEAVVGYALPDHGLQAVHGLCRGLGRRQHGPLEVHIHLQGAVQGAGPWGCAVVMSQPGEGCRDGVDRC